MEGFDEQQKTKHNGKGNVNLVSENGECQKGLGDKEPHAVVESLWASYILHGGDCDDGPTSTSTGRNEPKNSC